MGSSFYERLLLDMREKQGFYQDRVLAGNLSFDEYKAMTGRILGLQEAEESVKELYKVMFENSIKK